MVMNFAKAARSERSRLPIGSSRNTEKSWSSNPRVILTCIATLELLFIGVEEYYKEKRAAERAVAPWDKCGDSAGDDSLVCREAALFESWSQETLLSIEKIDMEKELLEETPHAGSEAVEAEVTAAGTVEAVSHEASATEEATEVAASGKVTAEAEELETTTPSAAAPSSLSVDWAKELKSLQDKLESRMSVRRHQRQVHGSAEQDGLMNEITKFGRELCDDPRHRNLPSCARFLQESKETVQTQEATGRGLRGAKPQKKAALLWSSVLEWIDRSTIHQTQTVTPQDLKRVPWEGKIPSVACIAAVPHGHSAKARMMYFIDNFKLAHYEGEKELVLVYHHEDKQAAALVQKYQESNLIRGVAARGDGNSTTSLRYGAYTSKADIIARWDFSDWHHPDRLSMQVRALAFSSRPASVLRQPTWHDENGNPDGILGWEGSLIGEARWMREHWHPLIEERAVLAGAQAHNVVEVEMEADFQHHDEARHNYKAAKAASTGSDAGQSLRGGAQSSAKADEAAASQNSPSNPCVGVDEEGKGDASAEHVVEQMFAHFGTDIKGMYSGLDKRRKEITGKLKATCAEIETELDPKKKAHLLSHAEHLAHLEKDLDHHFDGVWKSFGSAAKKLDAHEQAAK